MEKIFKECVINGDVDIEKFFNGKFGDIIKRLKDLQAKHSEYRNLRFHITYDWDNVSAAIYGDRKETDAEFEKRKEQISEQKNKKHARIKKLEDELEILKNTI